MILEGGYGAYYRQRTEYSRAPEEARSGAHDLEVYDHPEVQRTFVQPAPAGEGQNEAALHVDGLTCGACVWLIERRLAELDGVTGVTINFATRRARIRWDGSRVRLSAILKALAALGFNVRPYDRRRAEQAMAREQRALLWRLGLAAAAMMQVMMYAVPAYVAPDAMSFDHAQLMRVASLLLTAPVVLWSALPFYAGALRELRMRTPGMDTPVSLAVVAGFVASSWSTFTASGMVYFDTVTMFVFLLLGGRYLELRARSRAAAEQERLASVMPQSAERLDRFPEPIEARTVPAVTLMPGDHVVIRPGAAIPADGVVVEGTSAVDESLLTGESHPLPKAPGSAVRGGSTNTHQPLVMRVTAAGEHTALAGIVRLMDRAQSEKPAVAVAADRVARIFVTAILVIALAAAVAWYFVEPERAVWIAVAVLMVTCPCALSLATPTALSAATGALYRAGVLVTRAHALEALAKATHVVFDKTGTLSAGAMRLVGVIPLGSVDRVSALNLAAALEARSEHPIARALAADHTAVVGAIDVANMPGQGIEGVVGGRRLRIGTAEFVAGLHGKPPPSEIKLTDAGFTVVALGDTVGWIALFTVAEEVRPHARRMVAALRAGGRTVRLLSGDRAERVRHLAQEIGVPDARGDAKPQDKLDYVRALQRDGAIVAMVGDGVNDAPVLSQAQVSIAMDSGTELARVSADVVLTSPGLEPLETAFSTAARTMRVIRQNLGWATVYNMIAVPLAVLGLLSPLGAAVGMSVSSLAVVMNALRLAQPVPSSTALTSRPAGPVSPLRSRRGRCAPG
jgi:P-type Cu2+ transporter